jgi:hypothetical protein
MRKIEKQKMIYLLIGGPLVSVVSQIIFSIYLADITVDYIVNTNIGTLYFILFGYLAISLISSIIVSYIILNDLKITKIVRFSFIGTLLFLFLISNGYMLNSYPEYYSKTSGVWILISFPLTIFNFGLYVFNNIFFLFILITIIYFLIFVIYSIKLIGVK